MAGGKPGWDSSGLKVQRAALYGTRPVSMMSCLIGDCLLETSAKEGARAPPSWTWPRATSAFDKSCATAALTFGAPGCQAPALTDDPWCRESRIVRSGHGAPGSRRVWARGGSDPPSGEDSYGLGRSLSAGLTPT
jgi:hypothetical protein